MKWKVKYESKCDLNDGDYCKETGEIDCPSDDLGFGKGWIVDDTSKEDMKLLALFCKAVRYKFGIMGSIRDLNEVSDDEIIADMKADKVLKTMGVTDEEIENFVTDNFYIDDYLPGNACYEPHDYSLNLSLVPADYKNPLGTDTVDKFLLTPWNNAQ